MANPYSNTGHSSHNSSNVHGFKNVYRNDNAYGAGDAYKSHDPYKTNDPYAVPDHGESNGERTGLLVFWFGLKARIQEMANSDLGHGEEGRIMDSDKDQFKLMLFGGIYARAIGGIIVAVLATFSFYALSIFAIDKFIIIGAFTSFLFMAWILYFPAHQTYTAKEYVIGKNSIAFYKNWKTNFISYQLHIILGYIASLLVLAYISFNPVLMVRLFKYVGYMPTMEIDLKQALTITITSVVSGLFLYVIFSIKLISKAQEAQRLFYKENVTRRTQSQAEQYRDMLSSSELE